MERKKAAYIREKIDGKRFGRFHCERYSFVSPVHDGGRIEKDEKREIIRRKFLFKLSNFFKKSIDKQMKK
jgi:hypothetical protein